MQEGTESFPQRPVQVGFIEVDVFQQTEAIAPYDIMTERPDIGSFE